MNTGAMAMITLICKLWKTSSWATMSLSFCFLPMSEFESKLIEFCRPKDLFLQGGATKSIFKTVNFGASSKIGVSFIFDVQDPVECFSKLRQYQPTGPLFCTEFWQMILS